MNKKIVSILAIAFIIACLIPSLSVARADWSFNSASGGWVSYSDSAWKSTDSGNYEQFGYDWALSSFQLWSFVINSNSSNAGGLAFFATNTQKSTFEINDISNSHVADVIVWHVNHLVAFGYSTQITEFQTYLDGNVLPLYNPSGQSSYHSISVGGFEPVTVNFYRNGSSLLGISIYMQNMKWNEVLDVGASSWFDNVTIHQKIEKIETAYGSGYIGGSKTNEFIVSGSSASVDNPNDSIVTLSLGQVIAEMFISAMKFAWDHVMSVLPVGMRDALNSVGNVILNVVSFGNTIVGFLGHNYLLIIGLLGMYEMMFILKYVDDRNIRVWMDHYVSEWHFFVSVGNAMMAVARTIVTLIKWW